MRNWEELLLGLFLANGKDRTGNYRRRLTAILAFDDVLSKREMKPLESRFVKHRLGTVGFRQLLDVCSNCLGVIIVLLVSLCELC